MAAWLRVEPVDWGGVCRRGVGTPFLCDSQVSGGRVLLCPSKVWWVLGLSCGPASSLPWGSGSLPRLTSSQGEHERSPFSQNTHLPGAGGSLALQLRGCPDSGQTAAQPAGPSG